MDREHDAIVLPGSIRQMISGKAYQTDDIGMSKARVMVFDDCVLKIAPYQKKNEETVHVMRWLENKLPVPKVLCYECDAERQYLLMSRIPGKMACDAYYLERPQELAARLAEAIRMLWSIKGRTLYQRFAEGKISRKPKDHFFCAVIFHLICFQNPEESKQS